MFMFCAIFRNGKWQPSWNDKLQKIKTASYKKHSGPKLVNINQWLSRYARVDVNFARVDVNFQTVTVT